MHTRSYTGVVVEVAESESGSSCLFDCSVEVMISVVVRTLSITPIDEVWKDTEFRR